jgi:hypothetical protein
MPVSGMPVSGSPYDAEPRGRRYADEEQRVPRRRPGDDEAPIAGPGRRRADVEHYDEPTGLISRRARADEEYAAPLPPRGRRHADDDPGYGGEEPRPRGSRHADEDVPAPRARRAVDDGYPSRRPAPEPAAGYDDEPAPRRRRYAEPDETPDRSRGRRYAPEDRYDDAPPRRREPDVRTTGEFVVDRDRWSDDAPPLPRQSRSSRYAGDGEAAPRARRDRGADADRADSGRHSRSEFVDLAAPADPWNAAGEADDPEPDETPTLVDIAARRARKQAQQDTGRTAGRGARRGRGRAGDEGLDDAQYWRQLRGEAQ